MAEVAGLVLGVVGIVGVIGAFKDTIDLFNLVADSRHLGRDYEVLETKLDIEKTLLLQWANRVRLLSPTYDKQLDDPTTQRLVVRILECTAALLTDATKLTQRYGLSEIPQNGEDDDDGALQIARTPRVSDSRWEGFLLEYKAFRSQDKGKSPTAPMMKRARWIIKDKEKFGILIQELGHFTAKINALVPVSSASMRAMADEDVDAIRDLRELKVLLEASAGTQQAITESAQHALFERCKERILSKLWFRKIDDRRDHIAAAHRDTLGWALHPTGKDIPWDDLSEWLHSGSGIYWISGKAGSGKSTLMKHLYSDKRIHELLSLWAHEKRYYLFDYFFMNLGAMEQKSQEGLSRTLLHQILSTNRDLIPEALPYMWKEIHDVKQTNSEDDITLPSLAETKHAFSVIVDNCERIGRFCFLIDGLDEFVGDYMDGITFIKSLAANDNIKVIVSSRPIPDCVDAFANLPKLRLQDLNRGDIVLYVNDVVGSHKYMKRLIRLHANEGESLTNDVIEKSSGVFLWVVLACRSLLGGFADHDDISELRRRVDELPPQLEDLFQHMLGTINKRHREQTSRLLRLVYTQQTALWPNASRDMYAMGLAMIDDYRNTSISVEVLDDEDKQDLCLTLEGRLRSRCGGLLEMTGPGEKCFCSMLCGEHNRYIDAQIRFMHRTVFEFLNNKETWNLECLRVPADDNFDAATALSLYGLQLAIESLSSVGHRTTQSSYFFMQGLQWAVLADAQQHGSYERFFTDLPKYLRNPKLPRTGEQDGPMWQLSKISGSPEAHPDWHLTLLIAIEGGAVNFVRKHISLHLQELADQDQCVCGCKSILYHTVHKTILVSGFQTTDLSRRDGGHLPSRDIASVLLSSELNLDPNVSRTGILSPWILWLQHYDADISKLSNFGKMEALLFAEAFLKAGADPTPRFFPLTQFLTKNFVGNDELRDKSRALLLLIRQMKDRKNALLAPGNTHPPTTSEFFKRPPSAPSKVTNEKVQEKSEILPHRFQETKDSRNTSPAQHSIIRPTETQSIENLSLLITPDDSSSVSALPKHKSKDHLFSGMKALLRRHKS